MEFIRVGLAAFAGGIVNALRGWYEAPETEPFIARKFLTSVVRSMATGVAIAAGWNYTQGAVVNAVALGGAFLAGYGGDGVGHFAAQLLASSKSSTNPPPPPAGTQ